ncbi:hypothetical protein HNQ52_001712 [Chiayiivirga flava]|uniref:Uncharacterized protein n=1 Tax=Chiayiivirga flava TaxID=659595 RepID=A0A7W8D5A9_9GAMM|nr:hypothetical protein [Chiayiivirga flava]
MHFAGSQRVENATVEHALIREDQNRDGDFQFGRDADPRVVVATVPKFMFAAALRYAGAAARWGGAGLLQA